MKHNTLLTVLSSFLAIVCAVVLLALVLCFPIFYDAAIIILVSLTSVYTAKTVAPLSNKTFSGRVLRFLSLIYIIANLLYMIIVVLTHFGILDYIIPEIILQKIESRLNADSIVAFSSLLISVVAAAAATNASQDISSDNEVK